MNFKHSLVALALSSSVLVFSVAADPITVYGKANISAQMTDDGEGSFSELKSNASRFGAKGDLALDNGLTVFYQVEWGVDLADASGSDNIKSRDQYLGIKGDFGSVIVGRKNSGLKNLSKPVDTMNDYEGDLKGLGWKGENRFSDSVTYISPSLNGFSVELNYAVEDSKEGDSSLTSAVYYGDTKLKKSKWFAGVAMESDVKGYDVQRAVAQTKLGAWVLGVVAHSQESVATGDSDSGLALSSQYSVNAWKLKAQYQTLEDDNSFSLGADYKLGKSTKAYAFYTSRDFDVNEDQSWLAVGLEHKF
ncbi:porin [Paraglaciecola sp.]|uniref:porin n=1 Tax=Paraglaciecola sp. TaxID=1920173 RepID=UPI003EF6057D